MVTSTLEEFLELPPWDRALVATAVLLDGREAFKYLETDQRAGEMLGQLAGYFGSLGPELRMPLVSSLLRAALEELDSG